MIIKNDEKIPNNWQQVALGDVCEVLPKKKGLKKKEYRLRGDYPIFDQSQEYISGFSNDKEMVLEDYPVILFGDHSRVVKFIDKPYVVGNDGTKLLKASDAVDDLFAYYLISNQSIPETGYNRHFKYLKASSYRLPLKKDEQRRIAKILMSVDEEIEMVDRVIEKTERLKKGLMQELFTKGIPAFAKATAGKGQRKFKETEIGEVPEDWEVVSLNGIASINPKNNDQVRDDETVGFISMADVSEDARVENIQQKQFKDVKKGYTRFQQNDVLFAKITPCMENGKGGICPDKGYPAYFGSTEFHIVRAGKSVLPSFVHYLINFDSFRKVSERYMTGSAGQKRVQKQYLEDLKFALPPLGEQEKISNTLSAIDNKIQINKSIKQSLTKLKTGLMQNLLSGEVRVTS